MKPWLAERPPDGAWRGAPGRQRADLAAEQDRAAGGREQRLMDVGDGRGVRASVELKVLPRQRRIRAYLRWYDSGRSHAVYIGEVSATSRDANLLAAWDLARSNGLLAPPSSSWASSPATRAVMRANKGRDSAPELAVRSALHARGLRYRVGVRPLADLRRTADVVFPREHVAVFIDGCFWHGCPDHYRPSSTNVKYWADKVEKNARRDAETNALLSAAGWTVVRGWEHENPIDVAERAREAVMAARQ